VSRSRKRLVGGHSNERRSVAVADQLNRPRFSRFVAAHVADVVDHRRRSDPTFWMRRRSLAGLLALLAQLHQAVAGRSAGVDPCSIFAIVMAMPGGACHAGVLSADSRPAVWVRASLQLLQACLDLLLIQAMRFLLPGQNEPPAGGAGCAWR